jgi:ribose-phosphate pyrophosphokinase
MKITSHGNQPSSPKPGPIVNTIRESKDFATSRGRLLIASCRSGVGMANRVVERLRQVRVEAGLEDDLVCLENVDGQFSDSETFARLSQDVSGGDVYLFQALMDPVSGRSVDQNSMAFLIATRALREWGTNHVSGVLPYLAYARQDKPTQYEREPATANLMADISIAAGIDRLVTWHPHSPQIQGFYNSVPVVKLEAVDLFVGIFGQFKDRKDVIVVAPDAGATKFVTRIARKLNLNAAIASKYRPRPEEATIQEVIGDFTGKKIAIVLDDMISSGGTVHALIKDLVAKKSIQEVYLGASHNLCMQSAHERLLDLIKNNGLKEIIVTNSIPQTAAFQKITNFSIKDISDVLSRIIWQVHHNWPVEERKNG